LYVNGIKNCFLFFFSSRGRNCRRWNKVWQQTEVWWTTGISRRWDTRRVWIPLGCY